MSGTVARGPLATPHASVCKAPSSIRAAPLDGRQECARGTEDPVQDLRLARFTIALHGGRPPPWSIRSHCSAPSTRASNSGWLRLSPGLLLSGLGVFGLTAPESTVGFLPGRKHTQ